MKLSLPGSIWREDDAGRPQTVWIRETIVLSEQKNIMVHCLSRSLSLSLSRSVKKGKRHNNVGLVI